MSDQTTPRCHSWAEVERKAVACNREHGHGGAHTGTLEAGELSYAVSWWHRAEQAPRAVSPADTTEGT